MLATISHTHIGTYHVSCPHQRCAHFWEQTYTSRHLPSLLSWRFFSFFLFRGTFWASIQLMWWLRLQNHSKWFPQQCQICGWNLTTCISFVCACEFIFIMSPCLFLVKYCTHLYIPLIEVVYPLFSSGCSSSPLYWLHLIECLWWHFPSFLLTSTWLQWWIDTWEQMIIKPLDVSRNTQQVMVFKLVVVNQKGFEGHNNNTLVVVAGIQPWQKPGDGEPKRVQGHINNTMVAVAASNYDKHHMRLRLQQWGWYPCN